MLKDVNLIEREIENSLEAREKLKTALENIRKDRQAAEAKCARSFAADLRQARTSITDLAVARVNEWRTSDRRLGDRLEALEEMDRKIEAQIEGFKNKDKANTMAVLKRRIDQLRKESNEKKSGTEALNKQIGELEEELRKLSGTDGHKKKPPDSPPPEPPSKGGSQS